MGKLYIPIHKNRHNEWNAVIIFVLFNYPFRFCPNNGKCFIKLLFLKIEHIPHYSKSEIHVLESLSMFTFCT